MKFEELHRYYHDSGFSPTFANLKDCQDLIKYEHGRLQVITEKLNILPKAFAGRNVLEFGPDTGENALVFARWGANMTLVEPNPLAQNQIHTYFNQFGLSQHLVDLVSEDLLQYSPDRLFDFIVAEGFIYTIQPQAKWLARLRALSAPGAISLISYYQTSGAFYELLLKAILASYLREREIDPILASHELFDTKWNSIPHTRAFESWVRDVLINPFVRLKYFIHADQLLEDALAAGLALYSSWPVYRQPLAPYWHKKSLSAEEELSRNLDHLSRSQLSFFLGDMAYLTGASSLVTEINDAILKVLSGLDILLDRHDSKALDTCVAGLDDIRRAVTDPTMTLMASHQSAANANHRLKIVSELIDAIYTHDTTRLLHICNTDQSFIGSWGMPTHFAAFISPKDP